MHGALLGGYAGGWLRTEELAGTRLCDEDLAPLGSAVGAGVVTLLSEEACPVAETARVSRWMASQSTRQCGPCMHGLDALAQEVASIATGRAERGALRRVEHVSSLVRGRGACRHPDGGVRFILSALRAFPSEFSDHAHDGPCPACAYRL